MLDRPALDDLLETVATFLREKAVPALPAREAFEAKIAANALELARREAALGPDCEKLEQTRLEALLDRKGSLDDLNREFSDKLRDGSLNPQSPEITDHLWRTTLEKLRIDQPRYSAYLRAIKVRAEKGDNDGL